MALPLPVVARVNEVRGAPIGPGLWPSPRRQALLGWQVSGAQDGSERSFLCQGMLSAAHAFVSSS